MRNRVYSVVVNPVVAAAGGVTAQNFFLTSTNREFRLKSIYWDLQIFENVLGIPLNLNNQVTQRYVLHLGLLNVPQISYSLTPGAPAPAILYNGTNIMLHKPGQVIFNSFVINNDLEIRYEGVNLDLLLVYAHEVSLIIETEEDL
jgi:hypothetical protein